jgi:hypothetical protein
MNIDEINEKMESFKRTEKTLYGESRALFSSEGSDPLKDLTDWAERIDEDPLVDRLSVIELENKLKKELFGE